VQTVLLKRVCLFVIVSIVTEWLNILSDFFCRLVAPLLQLSKNLTAFQNYDRVTLVLAIITAMA